MIGTYIHNWYIYPISGSSKNDSIHGSGDRFDEHQWFTPNRNHQRLRKVALANACQSVAQPTQITKMYKVSGTWQNNSASRNTEIPEIG